MSSLSLLAAIIAGVGTGAQGHRGGEGKTGAAAGAGATRPSLCPSTVAMQVLPLLLGLCLCPGLMAQAPHHPHAGSSPRTFSYAVPDLPLTADAEVEVFSHTAARPGAVTHLWSTACGGRWIDWQRESGIVTYRYYVDDEAAPSVQFQMRWAAGIHFDPVPTLRPNADPTASGPPPALHPNRRPPVAGDTPAPLALVLVVAVAAVAVALAVALTVGLRPGVATGLGVASALALATVVAWRPVAAPGLPLGRAVSAPVPWGTPWLGKTSDMDGYYTNVPVPFGRRVRLTAQLPPGTRPFHVYSIARGQEGGPLAVGGWPLPPDARLRLHVAHDLRVPDLAFVPLLNLSTGSGVIFGSTVAVEGHPGFVYLEGCFHLITPYTTPLRRYCQGWRGGCLCHCPCLGRPSPRILPLPKRPR